MAKWALDPSHSELGFKVKHLMISSVKGKFKKYSVNVTTESDNFDTPKIEVTVDASSIDTGDEKRDQHLQSGDFFKTEQHPQLTFTSNSYQKEGDHYKLDGNLTINGISKPVSLNVIFEGLAKDPWGNTKAAFNVNGKISRKEWNLNWNAALETGGVLVSDEVTVQAEIQLVKQA